MIFYVGSNLLIRYDPGRCDLPGFFLCQKLSDMINVHSDLIRQQLAEMGVDAFAILMCITTHINAKRKAWPGIERLRKMTGLSKERTYKAVARLVELGHIERKQMNQGGEWGKVVYRLTTKYLGVYMGVSDFPMEGEEEPLAGNPEYGYPEHGKPEHGKPAHISIEQDRSIDKKEVLNNSNSLSLRDDEKLQWHDAGEARALVAISQLTEYFQANPNRWQELANEARVEIGKADFWDNVKAWIRWNADNWPVIQHPIKALTSGRSNFLGWLRGERKRAANKAQPEQPALDPNRFFTASKRQS